MIITIVTSQMDRAQKTHDQTDSNRLEHTFDRHQKDHADQIHHDHTDHDQIDQDHTHHDQIDQDHIVLHQIVHDHVDHDQINRDCVNHDQTKNDHIYQEHDRGIHLDHSSGQESLMLQDRMFISSCIELSASDFSF